MTETQRHKNAVSLWLAMLFMMCVSSPAVSAQESSDDPAATREYAVALGFQKKKLFPEAAIRWTQFIAKYANDSRLGNAHYHLGVCQLQSAQPEAAATFRKVLTQFPKFEQRDAAQLNLGLATYNLALASKKPEDFKAAAVEFANVPAQYAQSVHVPSALYYQAECVFQSGDRPASVAVYQKLIAEHSGSPLLPTALYALATTQQEMEQNAEASQTYRTFLEKFATDPKAAECRLRLGLALTALEKHAEAEREYAVAAAVPDFPLADLSLFHQARSKREQNQLPEAAALFESLPQKFRESQYLWVAMLEGGKCRFLANQLAPAKDAFTAVVNAKKDESPEAGWWLGRTLIQLKQAPEAVAVLERVIAESPQSEFLPELNFTRVEGIYEVEQRRPETVTLYAQFADTFAADELAPDARYRSALTALQLRNFVAAQQQSDVFLNNPMFAKHGLFPDALFVAAESRLVGDNPDFAKADAFYRRVAAEFPDHAQAARSHVRAGFCVYSQQQFDPAIALLNSALPKLQDPELLAEAQFLIGVSHAASKRPAEAVTALRASRQAKGDWVRGDEVLLALAGALVETSQPDAAIAELNQLNQQYSKSEYADRAWFRLGEIQAVQKKYDPAVAAFRQIVTQFPNSELMPVALYGAGVALFDKEDFAGAVAQLNELLSKFAQSEVALSGLYLRGLSQHRLKNDAAAIADLQQFLNRNPPDEKVRLDAQYSLALCHAALKQHEQTIQTATALLKAKPDYAAADKVLYELAFARAEISQAKEAADTFRELATRFPDGDLASESWLRVAEYHANENQFAEAAAACGQGLAKAKEPKLRERLQFRLGWSQFSAEAFPEAAASLQAQINEHPQGALLMDANWLVAESLLRQKKYQEALVWYQKPIDARAEKYQDRALYRAGTCANELKQWPLGQQFFTALTTQFPKFEQFSEALYGLGFAMQNQNQLDQALQVYERVTKESNAEAAAKSRFMMGECAFAQKKYDVAWQHFLEAALGYPYPEWQALGYFEAGRCFMELRMPDKARESLQTVVEKFPNHERAKDAAKLLADLKNGT